MDEVTEDPDCDKCSETFGQGPGDCGGVPCDDACECGVCGHMENPTKGRHKCKPPRFNAHPTIGACSSCLQDTADLWKGEYTEKNFKGTREVGACQVCQEQPVRWVSLRGRLRLRGVWIHRRALRCHLLRFPPHEVPVHARLRATATDKADLCPSSGGRTSPKKTWGWLQQLGPTVSRREAHI